MIKNILIIDDSALMRRVLSDIINTDPRYRVTGLAMNGLEALKLMLERGNEFDAILLDLNMPRMNGIEFLEQLKANGIKATVIVVSTIAKKDAKETIQALELGALDFVTKPESFLEVKNNLFSDKILKCLTDATQTDQTFKAMELILKKMPERLKRKPKSMPSSKCGKLVAIACSTGGPKALHEVIPKLPENLDASILIVQHMPGGFTKSLADRLNELSKIKVCEAKDGDILEKGTAYIAKGGCQMRLKMLDHDEYCLSVTEEPARHGLLPCADIMYESLMSTDFDQITCVVLTGMGADGTAGIMQLYDKKNIYVIAQNEGTSVVYGMPKMVTEAGLVDEVVALSEVSDAIIKNVGVR